MEALQSKISLARKGPLAKMNTPKKASTMGFFYYSIFLSCAWLYEINLS